MSVPFASPFPSLKNVPHLTTAQMIEVDRLMIDEYGITLIQMMENAGRCLAILARERFLKSTGSGKNILVLAGPGGNGGGAMVAARRLSAWGANVNLLLSQPLARIKPVPAHQMQILQHMGVPVRKLQEAQAQRYDLIIDGLFGYSLKGSPRGLSAQFIQMANQSETPVLALDVPSGLDADIGTIHQPTIKATATLTLALPKTGLRLEAGQKVIGELYCADISVPPQLYAEMNIGLGATNIFNQSDIIHVA